MFNLGSFEQRLNTDSRLQKSFLMDPVGTLAQEGVMLTSEKQSQLRAAVSRAQTVMGEHIKVNLELNFIKLKDPSSRIQQNF